MIWCGLPGSPAQLVLPMIKSVIRLVAAMLFFAIAGEVSAHPHVWVTMKSELVYAADGSVTGVRHAWTFDDMFSTYATQGLESKKKGEFTREELAPLAAVNVESLKEYDFFTVARANGKKADFNQPVDYWLEYTNSLLTLHFTLPFAAPVKAQDLEVEMYDPTWFVDFSFAEKDAAQLVGAPATCKLAVLRPGDKQTQAKAGESFFNSLTPGSNYGAQFSSKISVKCP
jgi:ABC-type uncharacterized transport system substrate-binding protein